MKASLLKTTILVTLLSFCLISSLFAQMPPHPSLLEKMQANKSLMQNSYYFQNRNSFESRGIDAPWKSPNLQINKSSSDNLFQREYGPSQAPSGTWNALVILVKFPDKSSQANSTYFDNLIFGSSYGSVKDFYSKVSYGTLNMTTANLPSTITWVQAPQPYSYYCNNQNGTGSYPNNSQKLVEDIVALVDPSIDFSKYDNDHDGYVDALFIVHTGPGAEYTGNNADIWSHAWSVPTDINADGVKVSHYSIEPEYWSTPSDMTIGVFTHELGHAGFGLPDLYDRDYSSRGLGKWSLMAGGSWNGASGLGESPALPDAWSHAQMGYALPSTVSSNSAGNQIQPIESSSKVWILWKNGSFTNEYFIIENRQQIDYDTYLPGKGLLIYHIDKNISTQNDREWYSGTPSSSHYLVALEQADGLWNLEKNNNSGDAADPFPGTGNKTSFSNSTIPDTKDYLPTATGTSVKNISVSGQNIIADFETATSDKILRVVTPNGEESWPVGFTKQIVIDALNTGTVKVEYTTDNGTTWTLIDNVDPSGQKFQSYSINNGGNSVQLNTDQEKNIAGSAINWIVPNSPSSQCKIRATSLSDAAITDVSDNNFSIFAAKDLVTLQYDNGACSTRLGIISGTMTIEGSVRFTQNIVAPYNGWLLKKLEIYIGNIPVNLKVKIYDAGTSSGPGALLHSQDFVPVAESWNTITLSTPIPISGNDIWVGYEVSLSGECFPMGLDSGPAVLDGDWARINGGSWFHYADRGLSRNWNIHAICENSAYVRVISPNGNERWKKGSSREITWTTSSQNKVKIELSTNNGTAWSNIVTDINASLGKYTWTVPTTTAPQCLVKVTDQTNTALTDVSDAVFSIVENGPITESEPNNTIAKANSIAYADTVDASINAVGDIDYYKFTGNAGDTVMVYGEARGTTNSIEGRIVLEDASGNWITNNYNFLNTNNKQRLVYILPTTNTYYIRYSYRNNTSGMPPAEIDNMNADASKKAIRGDKGPQLGTYDQGDYRLVLSKFKTAAPQVVYVYGEDINYNTVRFYGDFYPNGLPTITTVEYGTTTSYGSSVSITTNANSLSDWYFETNRITGLMPNTAYHFRMKLVNSKGTVYSGDISFNTPASPDGWAFVNSGTQYWLYGVKFFDSNTGYAVGDDGVFKTTDGGISWNKIRGNNWYQTLEVIDANTIYVGSYGVISKSSDGGNTWLDKSGLSCTMMSISFKDVNNGVVCSECGYLYKTTDGGTTWNQLTVSPTHSNFYTVKYFSNDVIVAAGGNRYVIRSTDGGATWNSQQLVGSYYAFWSMSFKDNNNGIMVGYGGMAFKTSDQGATWTSLTTGHTYYQYGVNYQSSGTVYTVGDQGTVYKSGDNGTTWSKSGLTGTTNILYGITTVGNTSSMLAVGSWGTMLRSGNYLKVVSPNGGDKWKAGSKRDIVWSTSSVNKVKIELSTNNGTAWSNIATDIDGTLGKYSWTVPSSSSTQCLVKVTDQTNSSLSDQSDAVFSIIINGLVTESEPNNTLDMAMQVAYGDSVDASINPINDLDYYKIQATAGDTLQVYAENRNGGQLNGNMSLLNSDGSYINRYIQAFTGNNYKQRYVYIVPKTATYYVRYSYWNNMSGMPASTDSKDKFVNSQDPSKPKLIEGAPYDQGDYRIIFSYFKKAAPIAGYISWYDLNYSSVRLYGQFVPNGLPTTATIEYGTSLSYGTNIVLATGVNSLNELGINTGRITGLSPNTTYHLRLKVENSKAIVYSGDYTFTTPAKSDDWTIVNSGVTNTLFGIKYYDGNVGYAVGSSAILKTTDGGISWTNVYSNYSVRSIEILSATKVVAVGSSVAIVSNDGGSSWTTYNIGGCTTYDVSFKDVNSGVAVTSCGEMFKTTDGGTTWVNVPLSPSHSDLYSVKYFSNNTIVATGWSRYVIRSTDGGATWTSQQLTGNGSAFYGMSFKDNNSGIIVGYSGMAFKTTDAGVNWTALNTGHTYYQYGVSYLSNGTVLSVGEQGIIYKSTDEGTTWTRVQSGTTNYLYGVSSIGNSSALMAVGNYGTMLRNGGYLKVVLPNGGEQWAIGSTQSIKWISQNVANINIDYSTNNGTNWSSVAANVNAASGSNDWVIPNVVSTNCLIKLTDASNASLFDVSDNVFRILNLPRIIIDPIQFNVPVSMKDSVEVPFTITNVGTDTLKWDSNNPLINQSSINISSQHLGLWQQWTEELFNSINKKYPKNEQYLKENQSLVASKINGIQRDQNFIEAPLFGVNGGYIYQINSLNGNTKLSFQTPTSNGQDGLAFDEKFIYYISGIGNNKVVKIDKGLTQILETFPTVFPETIDGLATDGQFLYALGYGSHTIYKVDLNTKAIIESLNLSILNINAGGGISFGGSRNSLFVSDWSTIYELDIKNGIIKNSFQSPISGYGFGYSNSTKQLFVSNVSSNITYCLNPDNGEIYYSFSKGYWALASDETGKSDYLSTNPNKGSILPNNSQQLKLKINANELKPGIYSGFLPIYSNDIQNNPKSLQVTTNVKGLILLSPNGSETFKAGTARDIKWQSNSISKIKIEFSTNNGTGYTQIATDVDATIGVYQFTIPNTPSANCLIKITDTSNPAYTDQSDATFKIITFGAISEIEPNNTRDLANSITYADTVDASINAVGDLDYYKFTGTAGDTVMAYGEKRGTTNSLYGYIRLLNQSGNYLIENQSFTGTSLKQRVGYVLPTTGTYYIRYSYRDNYNGLPPAEIAKIEQENKKKELRGGLADKGPDLGTYDQGDYRLILNKWKSAAPLVNYVYTTDITYNSARFYGGIYPNGLQTTVTVEYGTTTSYGSSIVVGTNVNSLNDWYFTSDKVTGLSPNTVYHFRIKLVNSAGTVYNNDNSFSTPASPEGWAFVNSGTANLLRGIKFFDSNIGYAVGSSIIAKTTDGGLSWVSKKTVGDYNSVEVIDASTVIAVGYNQKVSKSTDGGTSWTDLSLGCYGNMSISFKDALNGIFVTYCGEMYKTTDGGTSWNSISISPTHSDFYAVKYFSNDVIIASGYNRYVVRSTDGGATWTGQQLTGSGYMFSSMSFKDNNNGILVGYSGMAFKTSDQGATWTTLTTGHTTYQYGVNYQSNGIAYSVGDGGAIYKSVDNGSTWLSAGLTGTTDYLSGITQIGNSSTMMAVGDWGTILKSSDYMKVVSPNGGEKWKKGSNRDIVWSTSSINKVKIELSTNNGSAWSNIATDINAGLGKYTWTVPSTKYDQCLVKVTDQTNAALTDVSDAVFSTIEYGPTTESEPNNTRDLANSIAYADTVDASINAVGDLDYYEFTGTAGDTVMVYGEARGTTNSLYGYIRLLDQSGNYLIESQYFTNTILKQRVGYVLPATGTYYIRYSYQGNYSGMPPAEIAKIEQENKEKELRGEKVDKGPELGTYDQGDYRLILSKFKTAAPLVSGNGYSDRSYNSIRIYGNFVPNGLPTTATIEYGSTTSYGSTMVLATNINSFNEWGGYTDIISGLTPNTTYNYRMKLENAKGVVYSGNVPFSTLPSPEGWVFVNSGTTNSLRGIKFYDTNIGYSIGGSLVLKTTDGGLTWNSIKSGTTYYSIEIINANTIIVGGGSRIAKSTDGGTTWTETTSGLSCSIYDISFKDANTGVAVSTCGYLYKTTDGGSTWNQLTVSPAHSDFYAVKYFSNDVIVATGYNNYVVRSTDGGTTWTGQQLTGSSYAFRSMSFKDNNNGIIVGYQGMAFKTTDQGVTWTALTTGHTYDQYGINYQSNGTVFSSGGSGTIFKSLDNGSSWTKAGQTGSENTLFGITQIGNSSTMMAVGDWGTILRSGEYLSVASPNGGEKWVIGTTQPIKWSTSSSGNVKIDYTTDSGTNWTSVTNSTPASSGTYNWVIPNTLSSNCKVKITDLANALLTSTSTSTFTISAPPNLDDYVLATKGDTLVVKDEFDYGKAGALQLLMAADTINVPAGRVYQLHKNGYYSVISRPTSSTKVRAIIAGDSNTSIKNNQSKNAIPIITGAVYEGGTSKGGLNSGYDLLVKNVNLNSGNSAATQGDWTFFGINGVGNRLVVDNCLIEHNIWCEINPNTNQRVFFKNCYFVNLSGHTCRRNGGVVDFFTASLDTLLVENCTHVMTQGSLYKFRDGYSINRTIFNHNNFVNCAGYVFMNRGTATNISITNNIFVNSNVQAYAPILSKADQGEVDPDKLPMGLVNVTPDSAAFKAAGGGHVYVDKNLVYWDPQLTGAIPSLLNTNKVNGVTNWVSQMITMNARTQAAFNDNVKYPYLTEGTWFKKLPAFTKTATLFTSQIDNIIAYVKVCSDTASTQALPYWREVFPSANNFSYSDWPIPINLAYTDTDLLTGGINGFPVGDLNWFPTQNNTWLAQRTAEYAAIDGTLNTGWPGQPPITTSIIITDKTQTGSGTIAFGTCSNATDGIDAILGESLLPPAPPTGIFDARFVLPNEIDASLKDYRKDGQDSVKWNMTFQPGSSGYPFTFTWDNATLPSEGSYTLLDDVTGKIVNVDMRTTNTYTLTNTGIKSLLIKYTKTLKLNVALAKDWNIISVPVKASNMNTSILFPCFTSQTYAYENGYVIKTALENGKGYWIKYCKDTTIVISGDKVNLTTVPVKTGWNLIGPYDWQVMVSGITTTPGGIISSSFYEYNKGYIIPTKLVPGKGYWIKVTADGVLNLPAASSSPSGVIAKVVGGGTSEVATEEVVKEGISIRVSDALGNAGEVRMVKETGPMSKYDLPPVPPRGIFETRWSSDRRVEKSGEGIKEIVISSAEYPVTLTVTGGDVRVKDNVGGMIINQIVKKGESIRIAQKGIERITVEELEIPTEFRLLQNYPNPFNPETKIEYWLSEAGKITLKIYDVLGREVETLVDQVKEAGKYEINWNASKYSSGVYFYNIINGNNHSVKKMLLLK